MNTNYSTTQILVTAFIIILIAVGAYTFYISRPADDTNEVTDDQTQDEGSELESLFDSTNSTETESIESKETDTFDDSDFIFKG